MSLTGTSLNRILERHNEIEKQAKQLQQQVQSFAKHFNIQSGIYCIIHIINQNL